MVSYQDYYTTLDVQRDATQQQIQKSYRKLARKFHPDVNQDPNAAEKFKEITEAYEVLKDPEKRSRYDALGSSWQSGEHFQVPPEWADIFDSFGGGGRPGGGGTYRRTSTPQGNGFSDFFEAIFGGLDGSTMQSGHASIARGSDIKGEVTISLLDAFKGGTKQVSFDIVSANRERERKSFNVKIPAGTLNGSMIRLAGQGQKGMNGGLAGDLLIRVLVAPDPSFSLDGSTICTSVKLAPWEAVLGAKVPVRTLEGTIRLTIPAGTASGKKFRLKEKGFPTGKTKGDLLVEVRIVAPETLSDTERELYEKIAKVTSFNPRDDE